MSEGFFSRAAGQKRRAWLDGQEAKVANALRYYLGPTGIDRRANALSQVAPLAMSGTDYMDAATASNALSSAVQNRQPWEAVAQAGTLAGAGAAMMVPGVSYRMAQNATDAGVGAAQAARRFATEEAGAVGPRSIRAYHGSPHDFDRFDVSQTPNDYLWFSSDRGYAEGLAGRRGLSKAKDGSVFEVNLNAKRPLDIDVQKTATEDLANAGIDISQMSPAEIEAAWLGDQNFEFIVEQLAPGVKRGGHDVVAFRGTLDGFGRPTDQFVVFDENLIEIVRKYGIAGAASMLGVAAADVAQAMEQGPDGWQAAREKLRGLGMIE